MIEIDKNGRERAPLNTKAQYKKCNNSKKKINKINE